MTCEHCQELISAFLDNELEQSVSSGVQIHLSMCPGCAKICEDFSVILNYCAEDPVEETIPPNSKALWCRINNIIETEIQAEILEDQAKSAPPPAAKSSGWQFTLPQIVSSMFGIALISSLLTFVGIRSYSSPNLNSDGSVQATIFEKALGKIGLIETQQQILERRIKERQAAIEYWNNRVETRKNQWDNHLREAFDRNLREIDQTVFEHTRILQENPQDEISSEMLDSTLIEKMELLREFSEL